MIRPLPRTILTAILAALLLALAAHPSAVRAQEGGDAEAQELLDRIIENLRGESQRATLTLTVERPDRTQSYQLRVVSDGSERSLTRVVAPARDAGQAFLIEGDNIFLYTPRLGRVLRLPPSGRSNSFLGSDISFNDLAGDDYRDDYSAAISAREGGTVTLALTPNEGAPTPYGRLDFDADAETLEPLRVVYIDQRDTPVKEILFEERVDTDAGIIPTRFVVNDLTQDGYRTVAEWTEYTFGGDVPETCFRQEALERGCE